MNLEARTATDRSTDRDMSRRTLLKAAGAAGAAFLLPACAGGNSGGAISWQAIPSYSLQGTDPKRVSYLREQRAAFERESAYDLDPQVSSSDIPAAMAKLLLQASQGRAPDVAQCDGYIFGRMARYAQPLAGVMARHGLRLDDWFPSLHPVMSGNASEVRGLQFTTDVRVLYHRKDLVPTAPKTWDELISMARPLARQGQYVLFPGGRSEGAVTTTLWPQFWGQGAELFEGGKPSFESGREYDAMRDALQVVQRCVREGISPSRISTFGSEDQMNTDVVAGRVAMFLGGNWQAASLNNLVASKNFFDQWAVAPIPSISGERFVTSAGGWVWGTFTEDRAKADAAMDWVIRAYTSDAGMARWCSVGGYLPPRQSIYDRPDYTKNAFTPLFREHLASYARTRPGERRYLEVSNSLQIALSSVAAGTAGADEALDSALNRLI